MEEGSAELSFQSRISVIMVQHLFWGRKGGMDGVAILFKIIFQLLFILALLAQNACCLATLISLNFAIKRNDLSVLHLERSNRGHL